VVHVAVRVLPLPLTEAAEQPAIDVEPSSHLDRCRQRYGAPWAAEAVDSRRDVKQNGDGELAD
jgi:hypothetical protein